MHTQANRGASQSWITPRSILDSLGPFDLDPCACVLQPWATARVMISPPDDGLAVKWRGRVWLNPPYGASESPRWMRRMAEHGCGTALVASRTEVESWFVPFVWEAATAILFVYGRLYYHRPTGERGPGNAGHGSVLVAYGSADAERLRQSGIRGKFLNL